MTGGDSGVERDLLAGRFAPWAAGMTAALRGERDADVPCGGCTACCTSSQFVHIAPDEADALSHIPGELLFPAPGLPVGHMVMGYDERGHCPMLVDGECSIYPHRPRTCRTYDCRVFPASDLGVDPGDRGEIARRARRWRFDVADDEDRIRWAAVRAAARFVARRAAELPPGAAPANVTQHAVLAVALHDLFIHPEGEEPADPDPAVVAAEITRRLAAPGPG